MPNERRGQVDGASLFIDELARHRAQALLPFHQTWMPTLAAEAPIQAQAVAMPMPAAAPDASGTPTTKEDILDMVCDSLAAVLDTDLAEIKSDSLFSDMGFDSLVGVEFRNKVSDRTGLDLPAAMAYDYPTPQALADHIQELLGISDEASATVETVVEAIPELTRAPRSPLPLFQWDCVCPAASPHRRIIESLRGLIGGASMRDNNTYDPDPESRQESGPRGRVPSDVDHPDASFGIAPREAEAMDLNSGWCLK